MSAELTTTLIAEKDSQSTVSIRPVRLLCDHDTPSNLHMRIFALCWAGWMFDFYDLILYTFLLVPIGRELALSNLQLSYVLGLSLAATAVGGVIFGILADRFGRRPVLLWTILTFSVGTFLSGMATSFEWLLCWRILTGLGVGGEWATGQSYVAETFPPRLRGRFGAFIQTGATIGIALASLVGGFVAPAIGWRASFFVSVIPALVLAAMIYFTLPESDLWLARNRFTGRPVQTRATADEGFISLFTQKYRYLFFVALMLAILDMSAYWFTYAWLPGYLQTERGFSMAKSAMWILVTQAGGFLGYLTFGMVADSLGRRPAYSIYGVLWALGLLMITVLWSASGGAPAVILSCMFLVGFGTGMFGGYGPLFAEMFPTHIRNTAMGAAFNLARGVQFFTPVIIAIIAKRYGLSGGIAIAAFFAIATGAWVWMFPETKGKRLEAMVH